MPTTTDRIRALNDSFRTNAHLIGSADPGHLIITSGVAKQGADFVARAIYTVRTYSDFTPDNDPHGEHDFGSFTLGAHKLFWKIDYYDVNLNYGSPNAEDPSVTARVLTILLAEEY